MAVFKPFRVRDESQLRGMKLERVKDIYLDKDNGNTYFVLNEEDDILNGVKDIGEAKNVNYFLRGWVPEEIRIF